MRPLVLGSVFAVCASLKTGGHDSSEWHDWCRRVPQLASACRSGDTIDIWSAMGSKAWMQFVDWKDQHLGVHAYDMSSDSLSLGQDGNYSGHVLEEYRRWMNESKWTHRWTAQRYQTIALNLMGSHNPFYFKDNVTSSRCHFKQVMPQCKLLAHELGEPNLPFVKSWKVRVAESERIFGEYYQEVGALKGAAGKPPLELVLEPLVRLYAKQGLLHPARNANSRSRLFLLQTELVRHGGHPVMIQSVGDMLHTVRNLAELKGRIIDGWCAWEWALTTGASPAQAVFTDGGSFVGRIRGTDRITCRRPDATRSPEVAASRLPAGTPLEFDTPGTQEVSGEELDRLRAEP